MKHKNQKKYGPVGRMFSRFETSGIYAQEKDTLKSKTIEEVKFHNWPRNKARVATDTPVPIDVIIIGQQSVLSPGKQI